MVYLLILSYFPKFPFLLLVHVASPNGYVYYIYDYLLKYIEARMETYSLRVTVTWESSWVAWTSCHVGDQIHQMPSTSQWVFMSSPGLASVIPQGCL